MAAQPDEAAAAAAQAKAGDIYAHLYAGDRAQTLLAAASAPAPGSTAAAMRALIHSVSSMHPRVRYPAGRIGHLPAQLVAALAHVLPARLQDALLAI